jgi:TolB-like protein/Flp pilus assembly protein TadD/predicted Ser/Thr protein kinase
MLTMSSMKPERWQRVDQLFQAALEREPEERAAFIKEACGGDDSLRCEVEALLGADGEAGGLIETPAYAGVARLILGGDTQSLVGKSIGHFQIISLVGKGGMGEVYLARDTRLDRTVALKILPQEMSVDAERMRRFVREAKAASALNHSNVAHIYEIGETDGQSFIAMEYIEGQTLAAKINGHPLETGEIAEIGIQIADALDEAHGKGITHRDMKPANVMLTARGQLKVLDFGLAKIVRPESVDSKVSTPVQTTPGVVLGTVPYMSPEQALGRDVDHRSDLFSLGVVLYEMTTGRLPFSGANTGETLDRILHSQPEAMARFSYDVPAELERIVRKCLEKERERRYQSARELLVDLKNLKRDSGSKAINAGQAPATDATPAYRTATVDYLLTQLGRNRLARFVTLLLLVAVLVGTGLYLYRGRTGAAIDSIAVLPFANQNREPETEYLADGLTESIINNLTQVPNLRVLARNSAFLYKGKEADLPGAGQALGVRALVVGRVLQRGENLLVSAELVDVWENKQLWGQQYKSKLTDVFAVQEEMAREITEKLHVKLSGGERQQLAKRPTENLKAYQYYMQGRAYADRRTGEDMLTAIRYYDKAIEEDKNYALAYAGLADTYAGLGVRGDLPPAEGRRRAEEAARKALALDENLAEAHLAIGEVCTRFAPYNFDLGDRELRRAIELSPGLALAHYYLGYSLARQGRLDECFEGLLKARELDPLSPIIARGAAFPYYLKRDYVRAIDELRRANEIRPTFSTTWEIGIYIQNRLFAEALKELEEAQRDRKSDAVLIYGTGMIHAAQGKRGEALQIVKELEMMSGANLGQAHWIAKIYATLNERELALTWLERGLGAGAIGAFYKDDPVWDAIRSDARFSDLLRRAGIPL